MDDKVLHFATFFLLTTVFYWILDTNRRRTLNLALVVCTLFLGVGSEVLQGWLPNGRDFDLYDIVANVVGSLAGLGLCTWYHKRMLERKRQHKRYNAVPGEDSVEEDIELGETSAHEQDVTTITGTTSAETGARSLEEEVDNWDENALDPWEEDDVGDVIATTTAGGRADDAQANGVHDDSKKA